MFYFQGTIHPFLSTEKSFLHTASKEIQGILIEKEVGVYIYDNLLTTTYVKMISFSNH